MTHLAKKHSLSTLKAYDFKGHAVEHIGDKIRDSRNEDGSSSDSAARIRLNELPLGVYGRISHVSSANRSLCHRLLSMGIVAGQVIVVKGVAPLGDPIQVEALGYRLSLRKSEAANVQVTLLPPSA